MAGIGGILDDAFKGFRNSFKKDAVEAVEKKTFGSAEIAADKLRRGIKKAEQAESSIHLNRQKAYDDMFNSKDVSSTFTYDRNKVINEAGDGLNIEGLRNSRKEMLDRYEGMYQNDLANGLPNNITRDDYFKAKNMVDTKSRVSTKKQSWDVVKNSNNIEKESFSKTQQATIDKFGANRERIKSSANKQAEQSQLQQKMDGFLKKAIPMAVGGGLVLSMFSRGGQMSNSELYGQNQQYGGGY